MSSLSYRKADGPDLHLAVRRRAKARLALGWAILIGGTFGFLCMIAVAAGAPFMGALGIAAGIIAFPLLLTYAIHLIVEHE